MEDIVSRSLKLKKVTYTSLYSGLSAETNYTLGLLPEKATVGRGNEIICAIQEKFFILKLLCLLVLNLFSLSTYEIKYKSEKPCVFKANVIGLIPEISGELEGDFYELRLHTGNICSLMKNGVQIAKFEKEAKTEFENNRYKVFYSDEADFELCFIFCVLSDIRWFKDDTEWHAMCYEKSLVPFDKFKDRAKWLP